MKKGFTLIELLIVVAIIAILAAIAIPNFLQAQVRSKVSRVQADMRSAATALESYYVDHNAYPPDRVHYKEVHADGNRTQELADGTTVEVGAAGDGLLLDTLPVYLSTPVAYLTDAHLPDPFRDGTRFDTTAANRAITYHPMRFFVEEYEWNAINLDVYGDWRIYSFGPDAGETFSRFNYRRDGNEYWFLEVYDPTNGTISKGNIIRTQINPDGYNYQEPAY